MFAPFMMHAWEASAIVAVVAGLVGYFVILRGSAFVVHALPNGAFAGAAAAGLLGLSTTLGLGIFSVLGAISISWLSRRGRSDVPTALTIVLLLGLGSLFLSFTSNYADGLYALLFGEILGISQNAIAPTAVFGIAAIALTGIIFRPLMLSSLNDDLARARGLHTGQIELAFYLIVALVTVIAVPLVGALLTFSLLIGPASLARALSPRPVRALASSALIGLATIWASIALSYVTNFPVGLYVGTLAAVSYGAGRLISTLRPTTPPRA
jgi:zinc/manganese transport system permease protein